MAALLPWQPADTKSFVAFCFICRRCFYVMVVFAVSDDNCGSGAALGIRRSGVSESLAGK